MENTEQNPFPVIPWTRRDVWIGLGGFALWFVVSIAAEVLTQLFHWKAGLGIYISLGELLLLIPPWLLAIRKYQVGWSSLGLRRFRSVFLGIIIVMLIGFYIFSGIYSYVLEAVFHVTVQSNLWQALDQFTWKGWLWIGAVGIAPIVEEIFFRGFIFGGLRSSLGWTKAALISAALFAIVHADLTALVPIFVLGFAFAYVYDRSRSILPTILMHLTINAISMTAVSLLPPPASWIHFWQIVHSIV